MISRFAIQFSRPLNLFDGMFLRTFWLLVLGLDLVVGLVFDNIQNFGTSDFSIDCCAIIRSSGHWSVTS